MSKALGSTAEEEYKSGLYSISKVRRHLFLVGSSANRKTQQLQGQVGLLFTDTEPGEVIEWFKDFKQPDFARSGNIATRDVVLPEGPVMRVYSDPPEPFPHNEEPQLRKLGLHTVLVKGVPTLTSPHKLCTKGQKLTSEQAQLLKLIGERLVVFRVRLKAKWDSATGEVEQIEGDEPLEGGIEEGAAEPLEDDHKSD